MPLASVTRLTKNQTKGEVKMENKTNDFVDEHFKSLLETIIAIAIENEDKRLKTEYFNAIETQLEFTVSAIQQHETHELHLTKDEALALVSILQNSLIRYKSEDTQ